MSQHWFLGSCVLGVSPNRCFDPPPVCAFDRQETADYIGELALTTSTGQTEAQVKQNWRERCRAFLKHRLGQGAPSFRPRKKHRVKALHFLLAIDDQLRVGCKCSGLSRFLRPVEGTWPENPLSWPILTISADSGPDIWSAAQFLTRDPSCAANIVLHCDINHAAWNCAKAALKTSGLWAFSLMMLACINMRHGPFAQAMRTQQCDQALEEFLAMERPWDGPLFQEMFPKICHDLNMDSTMSEPGAEEWVWSQLAAAHPWKVIYGGCICVCVGGALGHSLQQLLQLLWHSFDCPGLVRTPCCPGEASSQALLV